MGRLLLLFIVLGFVIVLTASWALGIALRRMRGIPDRKRSRNPQS